MPNPIYYDQVIRALKNHGFVPQHKTQTHIRLTDANGVSVTIRSQGECPAPTLERILKQTGINPQEFENLLQP